MSGLQAVPPHIADNVRRLYRDCLRLAEYLGSRQGNTTILVEQVRSQFKKNMHETDPNKIKEHKEAAVRGLSNFMYHEAARMATASRDVGEP
eukprot:SM000055S18269  [mRNA]  locus=s55:406195:407231:+ [translate_table: standard]